MPPKKLKLPLAMDASEMKRLEKEIGVRDLTPEEIQAMFKNDAELEALVRERYPDHFAPSSDQEKP
jgi:hypothetical protein